MRVAVARGMKSKCLGMALVIAVAAIGCADPSSSSPSSSSSESDSSDLTAAPYLKLDPTFASGEALTIYGNTWLKGAAARADGSLAVVISRYDGTIATPSHSHVELVTVPADGDTAGATVSVLPGADGLHWAKLFPSANGELVIVGGRAALLGTSTLWATRVDAAGKVDTTFGNGGFVESLKTPNGWPLFVSDAARDASGRILVTGGIAHDTVSEAYASAQALAVIRLDANGKLDTSFGDAGIATDPSGDLHGARTVDIFGTRIVVDATTAASGGLLAFSSTGKVDATFGNAGRIVLPALEQYPRPSAVIFRGGDMFFAESRVVHLDASGIRSADTNRTDNRLASALLPETSRGSELVMKSSLSEGMNLVCDLVVGDFAADTSLSERARVRLTAGECWPGMRPTIVSLANGRRALFTTDPDGDGNTSGSVVIRVLAAP